MRGTSYGLMGGMIRLPVPGHDILLYSNVDTDAGVMPKQVGASIATGREKATVWASFDGGRTWPVKRLVYDGPSAYSNLGVGRNGTPSQGKNLSPFRRRSEGVPRSGSSGLVQPELAAQRSRHHHADRENTLVANNRIKNMKAVFLGLLLSSLGLLAALHAAELTSPDGLPFPDGIQHVRVERSDSDKYKFLHDPAIEVHKGELFAAWYNCPQQEIVGESLIRCRRSKDGGKTWARWK